MGRISRSPKFRTRRTSPYESPRPSSAPRSADVPAPGDPVSSPGFSRTPRAPVDPVPESGRSCEIPLLAFESVSSAICSTPRRTLPLVSFVALLAPAPMLRAASTIRWSSALRRPSRGLSTCTFRSRARLPLTLWRPFSGAGRSENCAIRCRQCGFLGPCRRPGRNRSGTFFAVMTRRRRDCRIPHGRRQAAGSHFSFWAKDGLLSREYCALGILQRDVVPRNAMIIIGSRPVLVADNNQSEPNGISSAAPRAELRFCRGIRTGSSGIMRSAVAIDIGTPQASDACRQREFPRPRSESAGEAPPIPGASSTQVPAGGRRGRPIGCGSPASTKGMSSLPTAAPSRRPSPPARPPRGSVVLGGPVGSAAPVGWVVDRSRVPGHTSKS